MLCMRSKAFLWSQIRYAYCISLMCFLSDIAKEKMLRFVSSSWTPRILLIAAFLLTFSPPNSLRICLESCQGFMWSSFVYHWGNWRLKHCLTFPVIGFQLSLWSCLQAHPTQDFHRSTFWEVGSGAIYSFLLEKLNQVQLFIHLFNVFNIYWAFSRRFCTEVRVGYYHLGIYQVLDMTVVLKVWSPN